MQVERCVGTVVWFDGRKGQGFIARDGGRDVFVHHTQILAAVEERRQLTTGDVVEFTAGEVGSRPQALDVRKVGHVTQPEWRQLG